MENDLQAGLELRPSFF